MSLIRKLIAIGGLYAGLGLIGGPALAATQTLDWDVVAWPASSLSESYTLGNGDVTITLGGNTAALDGVVAGTPPITPVIDNTQQGGFGGAQQSLHFAVDWPDVPSAETSFVIAFTHPAGVNNVSFTLFDVDRSNNPNNFWDRVIVTGLDTGGGTVDPSSIVLPGVGFNQLNPANPTNTVDGTASSPSTTGNANATFTFNQNVTQILVRWQYPPEGPDNDPNRQVITLHDVTFNDPEAELAMSKSVDNANPTVGQNIVFTLTTTNGGPDGATSVEVTDSLPAGYTFVSAVGDGTYNSGTGVWDIGSIANGSNASIDLTVTVNATGPYANTATITAADQPDPVPGNNSDSSTPVVDLLPVAAADTNTAIEGGADVGGDVLGNDGLGDEPTTVTAADQGGTAITLGMAFVTANGGSLTLNADGTYSYTPPALGSVPPAGLTEVFNYTITDADGDPSSSTLTITVNDSDLLPVAAADTNTAIEGGADVGGDVLGNDGLGDEPTTVTAADQGGTAITLGMAFVTANGGSLTLNADGTYSYTPPALGSVPPAGLTEVFNYTITDADGDPSSSTLTITVNDSDLLPVAAADTNTAIEGGADVGGDVLGNDGLGDEPTTVTAADQGGTAITLGMAFVTANGGSLTLNADGTYSYTPPALGSVPPAGLTEVFNYTITDADGDPSSSTLTITVNDSDLLPVAAADTNTAIEGGADVGGDVLGNDGLGDEPTTVTAADQGGTAITLGMAFVTANGGSLTLNADGTYSYTPPALGSVPPAGLTEVFNYTITDADGDPSSSTLTITVNDSDLLPVAAADTNTAIEGGADVGGDVLGNDGLGDEPTTVTAADQGGTAITLGMAFVTANGGSLTLNADGTYSYTPPALGSVPPAGLTEVFNYTITDADGDPSSSTLTITVNDSDLLPVAAADTNTAIEGGADVGGDVLGNDGLGDEPTTVTAADQGGTAITLGMAFVTANGGSLTLNADGTYSYTPPALGSVPPAGLTEVFNYTITDADGDPSSSTLTITVNDSDLLPVAAADTNTAIEGGADVGGDVLGNDGLGDEPTTVTAADQGGTAITLGMAFVTANGGSLTLNADGTYSYTPPALGSVPPAGLTEVFNYTITDADGDPSSSTLTITVNDSDLLPVAAADTNTAIEGGADVGGDVLGNDGLGDEPTTVTAADQGGTAITLGMAFVTANGGSLTLNADGTYSYTPPALGSVPPAGLTEVFNYTITDADGDPSSSTLTITVNDSDLLPVAAADTNTAIEGGADVGGDVLGNDGLGDEPTTVTAADQGGTAITLGMAFVTANGGSLTLNADGTYSYTPPALGSVPPAGLTEVFNYTITDADGDPSSSTLTITVNDSDLLPVAAADTNTAIEGGADVGGDVLGNDGLGDEPTTVTAADQGGTAITLGMAFVTANGGSLTLNADGTYSYTPPALGSVPPAGLTEVFNYTITDADGDPSSSTLTITVNDSDLLPVAAADTNTAIEGGADVGGDVLGNDGLGDEPTTVTAADQGGTAITLGMAFVTANGGSLTLNADGTYSYTPPALGSVPPAGLTEVFNYTITDADGDPSSSTLTITVNDSDLLPVAAADTNTAIEGGADVGGDVLGNDGLGDEPTTVTAADQGGTAITLGMAFVTANGGSLTLNADGTYSYTPPALGSVPPAGLTEVFNYTITDADGDPSSSTLTITVNDSDLLPVAAADTNTAIEGGADVGGDVLGNDGLGDEPTTVTAADQGGTAITLGMAFVTANGGSLTLNADGTYSYTPPALGSVPPAGLTEVFNYTITDADGDPSSSTLTITVNDSDLLPVAAADTNTAIEGGADVGGDVLGNDGLGDEPTTVTAADQGGTAITLGMAFVTANGGSLTLNADGTYSYTPPALGSVPPAGLTEVFNYTITDADGDPSSSTLTITVNDSDLLPVAAADTNTAIEGGADVGGDVLGNDGLGDEPTTVTAADQGGTAITLGMAFVTANGGSLTLNADGTYSYTPPALGSVPPAGLTEVFNYTITDADGDPSSSTLTITVNDSDLLPVAAADTNTAIEGGADVGGDVLGNDGLGDEPTTVTAADQGGTAITLGMAFVTANGGSLTLNADGTYSYTPPALGSVPPAGLTEVFNYTITDADGDPSSSTLTITVNDSDLLPVAAADTNTAIEGGADVGGDVLGNDGLGDEPTTVTAADQGGTAITLGMAFVTANGGSLTLNADGTYSYTPPALGSVPPAGLTEVFNYTITDADGDPSSSTLTITVNDSDLLPVAAADTNTAIEGGADVGGDVLGNDGLGDEPTTVTAADQGGTAITLGMAFVTANGGSLTLNADGTYSYTPPALGSVPPAGLTEVFNYTITDADGDPSSSTLTITVNDSDLLPVAAADTNTAIEGGADVGGDVLGNDGLGDEPTTVTAADQGGTAITLGMAFVTANGGSLTLNADGTYSYTPPALGSVPPAGLTEVFNYTITDADGDPSSSTLTITVNDSDLLPVAAADTNTAIEGGADVGGDVLGNDGLGDEPTTVTAADQGGTAITLGMAFVTANGGSLTLNADGTYSYTPPALGSVPPAGLTEVFNYTITDADGDPSSSTLTITVNDSDLLPVAAADTNTAIEGGADVGGDVLGNDGLGDEPTTVTAADQGGTAITLGMAFVTANGGSLTLNADGTYSYTPPALGSVPPAGLTEVFNYTITDADGDPSSSTLTITVNDSDLLPVAAADTNTAIEGGADVGGDVLGNDGLGDEPTTVTAADQGGTAITLGMAFVTANGGSLTLNADGTYSYTPPALGSVPPAGLTEVFNYTITDADGDPSSSTLTITLADQNQAPVAANDSDATDIDTAKAVDVLLNDSDPDGDTISISAVQGTTDQLGTAVINDAGTPGDPTDDTITYTPASGFIGTDTFTYTISDGNGGTDTATVSIAVPPRLADLSIIKGIDNGVPTVGDTVVFTVTLNNAGPDAVDVEVADGLPSGYSYVSDNGAGAYSDGSGVWTIAGLAANDAASLQITATVNATGDYTNVAEVAVSNGSDPNSTPGNNDPGEDDYASITPVVNQIPIAVDDSATTPVDTAISIPVLVNDSDPDADPLTVDSVTQPTNGSVSFMPDGTVIYTPNAGFTGTDSFTYTVSDGRGGFATANVTVMVNNVSPTAVADSGVTSVDTPITLDVLNNDTDPNGDPLTVVSVVQPPNGTVVINPDGTVTYTPDPGFSGIDTFTYTIEDPDGNSDSALVSITVDDVRPRAVDDVATTPFDTPVVIDVLDNDTDPNGDPLSVLAISQPANGTAVLNGDGTVTYTPDPGFSGVDTFTYTVDDGNGNTDIAAVTVTVEAAAAIEGSVWLDEDVDDVFGLSERPLAGWIVELTQNGSVIDATTVAADGSYDFGSLVSGGGYGLVLRNPTSNAVWGGLDNVMLPPGVTTIDQNLPVDPSGVLYDATARTTIPGGVVTITDGAGNGLPDVCLLPDQQDQVTDADGFYRFDVELDVDAACPSGAEYRLVVAAPAGYADAPSALIPPEAGPLDPTGGPDPFQVSLQPVPPTGADSTLYYLSFLLEAGDPDVINNHIPLDSVSGLTVNKRALADEVIAGGLVPYEIVIDNPGPLDAVALDIVDTPPATFVLVDGSARLDGGAAAVTASGVRPIVFSGIDVPAGANVTLSYVLRAGPGVVPGKYGNSAVAQLSGVPVSNISTAKINVVGDPDFSETTIIGKVFNDANGNGWQDEGEAGIPGVRLATVTGLLIETDQHGRYHIAGVDGGFMERGRNFILKADPVTLPPGAEFTTENPRVLRITQGMLNRIDFGVRIGQRNPGCCGTIEAKLSEFFFVQGSADLNAEFLPVIEQLAEKLREHGGGVLTLKGSADSSKESADLAAKRVDAVRRALQKYLGAELMNRVEIRTQSPLEAPTAQIRPTTPSTSAFFSGIAQRAVLAVLGLVAGPAYADEMCRLETCRTADGYLVEIIEHDAGAGSENDTRYAAGDKKRVDLSGRFGVVLPGQGMVWATEDPSVASARLAVQGPAVLPSGDGSLMEPANFTIYTNYAAFIERAELMIFDGKDSDRVAPLAVLPVKLGGLDAVAWDGRRADGRAYVPGDQLAYVVRAYDSEGRSDETSARLIDIVDARSFKYGFSDSKETEGSENGRSANAKDPIVQTPLKGNVLVMRPASLQKRHYTLTPRFGTRKIDLGATDKAALDKIIEQWRGFENIKVAAIGHTDNVRIAPENRKEFANNQVLSEARANTIAGYLQRGLGLAASQVIAGGRGPAEPVASNATATGRAKNRRVELTVTGEQVLAKTDIRLVNSERGAEREVGGELDAALAELSPAAGPASAAGTRSWRSGEGLIGLYGQNDLEQQNIPIYGSRVRVYGNGVGESLGLVINGQALPVDREGRFAVEYLLPVGKHQFAVGFLDSQGLGQNRFMDVEVTGRHMFLVGLADVTLSGSDLSGSIEPLAGDERYQDDFLVEGRLAFYLKGKVKGKYLVTAQMDTQEEELGDLFKNIHRKDPRAVFRRLDPDKYYPVYGDDSTTYSDTDTQGRMYVRVDWDKSQALWGNYHTGVTGNEFGQYNRSLYGARLRNRSLETTELGEAKREATVFLSEAQTALGHSEFLGTGGSLYYLRHQDILPGSEKAHIEIRDRDSNRVVNNVTLVRGTDYEIDELQGRMILTRPLAQITQQFAPSLIKDEPLDGNDVVLLVDYEYVPDAFDPDHLTVGGRGKQWLNDKVAVGVTAVDENRGSGEDYQLLGADVTLQAGRGTYLKAEIARTEASQAPVFYSDNGGLTFARTNPVAEANREGDALALEGRVNLREQGLTENDWTAASWWRQSEAGFSAARRDTGTELTEYGAEVSGQLNERLRLSTRLAVVERAGQSEQQRIAIQGDYRLGSQGTLSAEVRRHQADDLVAGTSLENTLAALRYTYRLNNDLEVYGTGQFTVSNDDGVANNDLGSVGARWRVGERTGLSGEYSTGHRGEAATVALEHQLNSAHRVYGAYTMSTDTTDSAASNQIALGHRSRITNQLSVFNESQFSEGRTESGLTHVFGLNFNPRPGWDFSFSLQHGDLEALTGPVQRDAATLSGGFRNQDLQWNSKLEYREDDGVEQREQWLSSNRANWLVSESMRMLLRFNFSDTDDLLIRNRDAQFVEGGLGLAYRPVGNDRLNVLAKYTYLFDLPSIGQANAGTDQKSNVYSVEGIYRLTRRWEIGGKVARRQGELRTSRSDGDWYESTTNFAAIRGRYHLVRNWDGVLEYRRLEVRENDSMRDGLLVSIDRHFGEHFKIGVGYNFTDFSDDLTDLDYDHKGWFLNLLGKY